LTPYTTVIPLVAVLMVSALKDAVDDFVSLFAKVMSYVASRYW